MFIAPNCFLTLKIGFNFKSIKTKNRFILKFLNLNIFQFKNNKFKYFLLSPFNVTLLTKFFKKKNSQIFIIIISYLSNLKINLPFFPFVLSNFIHCFVPYLDLPLTRAAIPFKA